MALAGLAFVGYAAAFLALNFSGAFLELGIGPEQVDKGRAEVQAFSPQLYHYISHLHIALSGFIAATGWLSQPCPGSGCGGGNGGPSPQPSPSRPSASRCPSRRTTRGAWQRWDTWARFTLRSSYSWRGPPWPTAECGT